MAIGNRQSAIGFLFPGQGSQHAGMGKDLAENFEAAREIFEEADAALGFALSELCFNGPADQLQLTENTQPAILTVSIAALRVLESEGFPKPDFVAGHSLGEYSALVAAGALSLTDAVRTVRARGRYMQEAVPVGVGAMAAILGASLEVVMAACADAAEGQVCSAANINSPGQVVIAGDIAAIDRAIALLQERGARRAMKLNVSAPFHCALMQPAQERLAVDLNSIPFKNLSTPLVTNVDAKAIELGAEARDALVRQVSQPVRWLESVEFLIGQGVQSLIEIGPGKVLSGLVRQIDRNLRCVNVEDKASLCAAREALSVSG
ncbi:MAG TPA: ACP S-malonyltransferase [Pyrinomonadaceae bacterium]|nr:ACP S-malonyltransferase [Pyrinomonadaceae bacterium]